MPGEPPMKNHLPFQSVKYFSAACFAACCQYSRVWNVPNVQLSSRPASPERSMRILLRRMISHLQVLLTSSPLSVRRTV